VTRSDRRDQPASLDAHRAARGEPASEPAPADPGASETAADSADPVTEPSSFEDARAVRRARQIELLREVVESGDYRPDPSKIAESMMENERS